MYKVNLKKIFSKCNKIANDFHKRPTFCALFLSACNMHSAITVIMSYAFSLQFSMDDFKNYMDKAMMIFHTYIYFKFLVLSILSDDKTQADKSCNWHLH